MKKQTQTLLQTKVTDLLSKPEDQMFYARKALGDGASEADVKKEAESRAEKAQEILKLIEKPLGTSDRPYPMWGPQRIEHNGKSDLEQVLSVIADDTYHMKVYSDRSYKEVVALAYCDMPVPSMLPLFFDGLERRKPESTNRTQMLIGDPGHGKSFMGALQSRMRSTASVEVLDCGGKNMRELLFEMVLDFGAGDALPKAIDKRLQAGTLEALSYAKLKQMPSEAVTMDGNSIASIDWNYFKSGKASHEAVNDAFRILKEVSQIEGLDNAGGNALGMNSQYGILPRKWMAGEEIVLDEYNKSREGTDDNLQTVWQFMIGEIRECTVENPLKNKDNTSGPSEYTFRREDLKQGFFITLTGNKKEDGVTTRSLNKSVYSRLSPQTLPDPDVLDWQHRICQMMVGLPVSTLYMAFKDQADADPNGFGDWLMQLRKSKAEIEGAPMSDLQHTLLSNWQNVLSSSNKLAKFYDRWSSITDSEKIITNGNGDLVEEVDDEYSKKEGIDFRKIKQHLEEALSIRPRMQPQDAPVAVNFGSWEKAPKTMEKVEENPSLQFGTRLVEFLERMVYEKSGAVGKDKLYQKLRKSMDEFGLREVHLMEGARSKQRSVEEDLNISAFADRDLGKQAQLARKVFCDYIRQAEPEITATDDQIITHKKFHDALKAVAEKNTAETSTLFFVNRDHETLAAGKPFAEATIEDAAVMLLNNQDPDFTRKDLVHHDDFMASLAMPTVGNKNLGAIWEANLRPLLPKGETAPAANNNTPPSGAGSSLIPDDDEAMFIAENKSSYGIAMTSVVVRYGEDDDERVVPVHIVRNTQRNKTLVVGEQLPSKLLAAFREAGVIQVDRNDPHAKTKVEAALTDLTRGTPASIRDRMKEAFKYRNRISEDFLKSQSKDIPSFADQDAENAFLLQAERKYVEGKQVQELLVDRATEMNLPKFVLKKAM